MDPDTSGGWTFFKVLGVIVGVVGMVGFSFVALCGIVLGVGSGGHDIGIFLTYGIGGLLIVGLFVLMIRAIIRSARRK